MMMMQKLSRGATNACPESAYNGTHLISGCDPPHLHAMNAVIHWTSVAVHVSLVRHHINQETCMSQVIPIFTSNIPFFHAFNMVLRLKGFAARCGECR